MQRTHLIHFSHDSSFSIRLHQDHTRAHPVALHAKLPIMRIFGADLQQCFGRDGGASKNVHSIHWAPRDNFVSTGRVYTTHSPQ
ncbi:hypothetical protein JKG47_15130 [Acidithiobacillus sp. MC6.1]|nr:hypothetical protein [Acidithiobacillus sp. MC6.1]